MRATFFTVLAVATLLAASLPLAASDAIAEPTHSAATGPTFVLSQPGNGAGSGEPSVGVDHVSGDIFAQYGSTTYRLRATSPGSFAWQSVRSDMLINLDPILATDPRTGLTFAGGLDGTCTILSRSDDRGESWTPVAACSDGSFDHPSVGVGPFRPDSPLALVAPAAVYYCGQSSIVQCAASYDGGLTFQAAVPVPCMASGAVSANGVAPGLHGSLHVRADGIVILPFSSCASRPGLAYSLDHGLTWAASRVPRTVATVSGFDADAASTPDGTTWLAYVAGNLVPSVAHTRDLSDDQAWVATTVGSDAGVAIAAMPEMVAGDDGRVAVVYLGSTTPGDGHAPGFPGAWYLYASYSLDAGQTWQTTRITDTPVQRGYICDGGIGCSGGRNLLDFIDAQVDANGHLVIAFADGCVGACETNRYVASRSARATVAIQMDGPGLFA